jgi:hypothetical protein
VTINIPAECKQDNDNDVNLWFAGKDMIECRCVYADTGSMVT